MVSQLTKQIDAHVGKRLRLRRTLAGMSQRKLGEAVGLTFQQIHKYERGDSRIGSGLLYRMSQVLDVPVSFFFDDMDDAVKGSARGGGELDCERLAVEQMTSRETLELVRAYNGIDNPVLRDRVRSLLKGMARPESHEQG